MSYSLNCPHCNRELTVPEPGRYNCTDCGQTFELTAPVATAPIPPPLPRPTAPPLVDPLNDPLFAEAGVFISRSQIITRGATFAVPQIAGVMNREIPAKRGWPVFFILLGICFAGGATNGGGTTSYVIAAMMIIPSIILLVERRTKYAIALQANGGEYKLEFTKREQATRAAWALSQAMAAR
jgi:hypothetical protein